MRKIIAVAAALVLSGCGGETYPIPQTEAFNLLSGIGSSSVTPLPGGLHPVSVDFESIPGDNLVKWQFSHEGDDLAAIYAQVTPEGENASLVTIKYAEGKSPDENWRNAQARRLIQNEIQRLVVESVDSTMEKREFRAELRHDVVAKVTMASMGAVMGDVSDAMDKEIARREEAKNSSSGPNQYAATRPSTNLSKYNN